MVISHAVPLEFNVWLFILSLWALALTKSNFAGRHGKMAADLGAKEINYIGFGQDITQPLLPTGTHEIHMYFH